MSNQEPRCDGLKATDGGPDLNCDRTERHLIHRDKDSGQPFVRVPGGVLAGKRQR